MSRWWLLCDSALEVLAWRIVVCPRQNCEVSPAAYNKFIPGTTADHIRKLEQHVAAHPESFSGHSMLAAMRHFSNAEMLAEMAPELGSYAPALKELHHAYMFDEKVSTPACI